MTMSVDECLDAVTNRHDGPETAFVLLVRLVELAKQGAPSQSVADAVATMLPEVAWDDAPGAAVADRWIAPMGTGEQ